MRFVGSALIALVILCCAPHTRAEKINFDPDWRFIKQDLPDAKNAQFDDSSWTTVSCPHTYNDIDTFDDYSLAGHRGEQNQFGGRTWYRKTFDAPAEWKDKKVYIEFEAARQVAEVYLNGELLGVSKTGFLPFGFDLTPHLKLGQKNVISVMCDNRFMKDPPERGSAQAEPATLNVAPPASGGLAELSAKVNATIPDDVDEIQANQIPWNNPHWHPAHGGLYRNVYLHVLDPLHVSLPLYSFLKTEGPYVYTTDVSDKSATVNIDLPVQNDRSAAAKVQIEAQVVDHDGKVVATLEPVKKTLAVPQIDSDKSETFEYRGKLENPQLWESGYPYLYRLVCTVRSDGKDVDQVELPLGIRTFKFDAKTGFWINGHHEKLHGWGQKPTDEWPGLGAAQPDWMHWYTLDLMKQAGGNWVRWGHCAAGEAQIEACNELGVMVHQPGLDGESDTRGAAWKIRAAGFRDMLIYFRNNPSIMLWEAGNQKVTREHAKELRDTFDKYDPHGGRAFAFRRSDKVVAEFETAHIDTEGGREIKNLPVIEGEYDREESPRRVWDNYSPPNFGYPEAKGMTYDLTSEEYAVNEVEHWIKKCGAPDHCGGSNWIFSDSTSGGRVPAEVSRASGEVDGARLPKEAYYVCQTMFRTDPQVHIIGHWSYPANTTKNVYVTSNGDDVELFVNGTSLGHAKATNRYLFTFKDVKYQPGEIKAVAYLEGKPIATEEIKTAGDPVQLKLTSITGPGGFLANGSDVALIDVEAIDAKGERCPTFQQRCDFTCTGDAIWRGGYNSGKEKSINNPYVDLECGINRVAVHSTLKPGKVVVTATVKGLPPASVEIESHPSAGLPALPAQPKLTKPAPPDPRLDLAPANQVVQVEGKLITGFSYSGPKGGATVKSLTDDGSQLYSDREALAKDLPGLLKNKGAEYIQLPAADASYSALDLIQFNAAANMDVYIAHDDAVSVPKWLSSDFKKGTSFTLNDAKMTLYKRSVKKDTSLTLGSNFDEASPGTGAMYIVIAVPK
jgi:beta-galactosidase